MTTPDPPALAFTTEPEPSYGTLESMSPLLRRMVCRNPSKFTYHGTGTYVIGHDRVAVVDPGPNDPAHLDALLAALSGERVDVVLVTHTHGDHSPGARILADATGAAVLAHGPHPVGAHSEGEESDVDFTPDSTLAHGEVVAGPKWSVVALHTPGHMSNHLCFEIPEDSSLLSGDHIMGWSTSVIPPPDGNIADYLRSLALVRDREPSALYPTHGGPVTNPGPYIDALIAHRNERERQIAAVLSTGPRSARELVAAIYTDTPDRLHDAAARSVLAHLVKLRDEGRAAMEPTNAGEIDVASTWRAT